MNFLMKDLRHKLWKGKFISTKRSLIIWNMRSLLRTINFKSTDTKSNYPTRKICKSSSTNRILNTSASKSKNLITCLSGKTMTTNNYSTKKPISTMISQDFNKPTNHFELFMRPGKSSLKQC
jgi:hypothetical protein